MNASPATADPKTPSERPPGEDPGPPGSGGPPGPVEGWLRQYLTPLFDRVALGIFCAGQGLRLDLIVTPGTPLPETTDALLSHLAATAGTTRFALALLHDDTVGDAARRAGLGQLLGERPVGAGVRPPRECQRLLRAAAFSGRTEQLNTLDWAWQEGARVMALIAPAGCGKTAIIQNWLDGRGLSDPRRWQDFGVEGLFVWSFADDPDVASFLRTAADYVEGQTGQGDGLLPEEVARRTDLQRLIGGLNRLRGHVLLVLDGLERFQAAPTGGADPLQATPEDPTEAGEILDAELRALLVNLAAVDGESAVLCTLEREVPSLRPWRGTGYMPVRVSPLALPDAVRVLRQCGGNRGDDRAAERRCIEHGGHALTIDLMSRFLGAYYHGDVGTVTVSDLPPSDHGKLSEAPTLRRVLRAHLEALTEPQRGLLEICVLLPGPIRLASLCALGQVAQDHLSHGGPLQVEGLLAPLRGLDTAALHIRLSTLARLGLVHLSGEMDSGVVDVHPLLRRVLYQGWLASRSGRPPSSVTLPDGQDPLPRPQDTTVLDFLEQLVLVALEGGLIAEAYHLLVTRMGGYPHLGRSLGEYRRLLAVLRILSPVLATVADGDPLWAQRYVRVAAWEAQTLRDLGQISESLIVSTRGLGARGEAMPGGRTHQVEALILAGRLQKAGELAAENFYTARSVPGRVRAALQQARVLALQGEVALARVYLIEAELTLREEPEVRCEWEGRSLHEALDYERVGIYLRLGEIGLARPLVARSQESALRDGRGKDLAMLDILIGEIARRERDPLDAAQSVHRALSWGSRTGDAEVLVMAGLCHARIRMETGNLDGAASAIGMALPSAMELGLELLRIDLLLVRGALLLRRGDVGAAETDARDALAHAMSTACGYVWGEADALHLLALVLLAGRGGKSRAAEATAHLQDEIDLRERMGDPRGQNVRWLLARLAS